MDNCLMRLIVVTFALSWQPSSGAKICKSLEVRGARYILGLNGIYNIRDDLRCQGASVYQHQNFSTSPVYMYRYWRNLFSYGWTIGPTVCQNDRDYTFAYQHSVKLRPDRKFGPWIELDIQSFWWRENHQFDVRCTEGLSYGAVFGIAFSCTLLGVGLLIGIPLILSHMKKAKRQATSDTELSSNNERNHRQTPIATTQIDNPSFTVDTPGMVAIPGYCVMDPPSYQQVITDQPEQNPVRVGPYDDGALPPPYASAPPPAMQYETSNSFNTDFTQNTTDSR